MKELIIANHYCIVEIQQSNREAENGVLRVGKKPKTMTEVQFDPKGGKLWASIEMRGLYRIYYRYTLWSMHQNKPVVLTEPPFINNNITPHDDFLQIKNDFTANEPVAKHDGREIFVEFNIVKTGNDNGYNLDVIISQGKNYTTSLEIGRDHLEGDLGGNNSKDEYAIVKLKKN